MPTVLVSSMDARSSVADSYVYTLLKEAYALFPSIRWDLIDLANPMQPSALQYTLKDCDVDPHGAACA